MKVEALTPFLHEGIKREKEDTFTVSEVEGTYFCKAGWCKDLEGKVATEENPMHKVIRIDSVKQSTGMGEG